MYVRASLASIQSYIDHVSAYRPILSALLEPFETSVRKRDASFLRLCLRSHAYIACLQVRRQVFVYAEKPWGPKRRQSPGGLGAMTENKTARHWNVTTVHGMDLDS